MALTRERLAAIAGYRPQVLSLETRLVDERGDHVIERLAFRLEDGTAVRGFLTRPVESEGRALPALLYAHAHGNRFEIGASELVDGRPALIGPPGPAFAAAGYVTLSIDMPTFGDRAGTAESAAAKAGLWHGRPLFGQMLGEQAAALGYLGARPDVDPARIGMTGISMGATLAYFLAALDPRVRAIAHLCCFADFASLVASGAHDLHGHYLTLPGLLAEGSTGEIAGLVAPRPQLVLIGSEDPLTPAAAVERAMADARLGYDAAGPGSALTLIVEQGVGHRETPAMRKAVLEFFARALG